MLRFFITSTLLFIFTITFASPIQNEAAFFSFGGEKVVKVADFPDTADFMNIEGRYFDAGIIYKQFSLFFIPVWNYEARWCAYLNSDTYIEMGKSELDTYAKSANVQLPDEITISFWDRIGGKLLAFSLFIIYMMIPSDDSEE